MKDITVNLTPNEASGEAYWRKRCDVVEAEIERLRAKNEGLRLKLAVSESDIFPLRAEIDRLKSSLRTIILMCGEAEDANIPAIRGEAEMALNGGAK